MTRARLPVGLLLLLSAGVLAKAQVPTPEAAGLGEAVVAHARTWGTIGNPAAHPNDRRRLNLQAYGTTVTGPAALTRIGVDVALKRNGATTGFQLGIQQFNPPGYGVTAVRVGASRRLGKELYAGMRFGALLGNYEEYGRELLPIAEGGIAYQITPTLRAGAHYTYVSRALLPMAQNALRLGVDYASSAKVNILVAVAQAVSEPVNGQIGLSYAPAERLRMQAGYQSLGQRISFGSGFTLANALTLQLSVVVYGQLPAHVVYGLGRVGD